MENESNSKHMNKPVDIYIGTATRENDSNRLSLVRRLTCVSQFGKSEPKWKISRAAKRKHSVCSSLV